jgi:HEAT repeat protein
MGQFAGLFYHGNPIMAMESMIRFYRARDEAATISVTERLGQSHSPLTVNELQEALEDPRFLVRFEALISIGRLGSDERLRASLVEVLHGEDPALSVLAAWALGRTRDPLAIEPLRSALDSRYRSVRAHVARSLAGLGDSEVVPLLEELLEQESDPGLRVVYASSLARLESEGAIPEILGLMQTTKSEIVRKEMALALARLVGNENAYIQLLRQVRQDPGTALSQATMAVRKKLEVLQLDPQALELVERSAGSFARGDIDEGVMSLVAMIGKLPREHIPEAYRPILATCVAQAKSLRSSQIEYPILLLHLLGEIP